jgi:UTP--glucose-1-phosphate uridylyltransferase
MGYGQKENICMKIKKALITAAGKDQRTLPLQTLVDRDGIPKAVLRIIIEQILNVGIDEVSVVVWPGDEEPYREAAGDLGDRLHFIEQPEPKGYGNAIYCCRDFVGQEPFLHLLGDHIYCSRQIKSCAAQLMEVAASESCAVSAVQSMRESKLSYYGAIGARRIHGRSSLYLVEKVIEKPTPTEGELYLVVPGLRAGRYLCFFGMHVLTPAVMNCLSQNEHLSTALDHLARQERYLALEMEGQAYDVGVKYGLLTAQLALALRGEEREEVLTRLVELLAERVR